jgi:hypothetical protein
MDGNGTYREFAAAVRYSRTMTVRLASVLACAVSALYAQGRPTRLPRFEDYRVSVYAGRVASPAFGNPAQHTGTDLRCFGPNRPRGADKPNFAGQFVVDKCSCGSGCHYLFMWDTRTGRFYRNLPLGAFNVGPYQGDNRSSPVEYSGESFRPDSRLLIIDACREDTCDCGKHYYVWTGDTFRMLMKTVSRIPPKCGRQ